MSSLLSDVMTIQFPAAHEGPADGIKPLEDGTVQDFVQLFKLLADDTRLQILNYLLQRDELHVRALCDLLKQSQPAVSHHLALLKMAGLIECRRDGKHNFYHLMPKRFQQYLETVFGGGEVNRKIRVEDSVISYAKNGQAI
jgi:DNA-binding transcriptional ArsR family regulator